MYKTLLSITNYKGDHFWCKKCLSYWIYHHIFSNIKVYQFLYSWRSWMSISGTIFSEQFKNIYIWIWAFFNLWYFIQNIVRERFDDGIWNLLIMVLFKVLGDVYSSFYSAKYDNFFITIIKDMFLTLLREAYFNIPFHFFFYILNKRISMLEECLFFTSIFLGNSF